MILTQTDNCLHFGSCMHMNMNILDMSMFTCVCLQTCLEKTLMVGHIEYGDTFESFIYLKKY